MNYVQLAKKKLSKIGRIINPKTNKLSNEE